MEKYQLPFECGKNTANKEEAIKAYTLGNEEWKKGNIDRAEKFLRKSLQLFELDAAVKLYFDIINRETPIHHTEESHTEEESGKNKSPQKNDVPTPPKKSIFDTFTSFFSRKAEQRSYEAHHLEESTYHLSYHCVLYLI